MLMHLTVILLLLLLRCKIAKLPLQPPPVLRLHRSRRRAHRLLRARLGAEGAEAVHRARGCAEGTKGAEGAEAEQRVADLLL